MAHLRSDETNYISGRAGARFRRSQSTGSNGQHPVHARPSNNRTTLGHGARSERASERASKRAKERASEQASKQASERGRLAGEQATRQPGRQLESIGELQEGFCVAHSIRTTMYFYSGHHGAGQLVNRHSRTDALFRLPALLSRRRLRRRLGRRLGRCRGRRLGRRRAVRVANSLLHPPPPSPPRKTYLRERERERR